MPKFIKYPFALAGDKTAIPNIIQPDGSVSYVIGWGEDYSKNPQTTVVCQLTGDPFTVIPAGSSIVRNDAGFSYQLLDPVILDTFGEGDGTFQSMISGDVPSAPGEINTIVLGVVGWNTVSNSAASVYDTTSKKVPRFQSNQVLFDATDNINQYQTHGFPDFITALDNEGALYPYDIWAIVRYDDGFGMELYQSIVNGNNTLPTNILYWNKISDFSNLDNSVINLIRNPQFTTWGNDKFLSNATTNDECLLINNNDVICDDWKFIRNNNSANVNIFRVPFPIGQTEVPGNPLNYMRITSDIGSAETIKAIVQESYSASTLSGTIVSAAIWARSPTSSTAILSFNQDFDQSSGGSPPVNTQFLTANLTPVWTKYTATITIPTVFGKTIGANYNDFVQFQFILPLNQDCEIHWTNVQEVESKKIPPFRQNTINNFIRETDSRSINSVNPTGTIIFGIFSQASPGWVLCNDGSIGNPASGSDYASCTVKNLYILLWETVSNLWAPVLTPLGIPTTRGFTAIADYNSGKRLLLTKQLGRSLSASGSGSGLTSRNVGQITGAETVSLISDQNGPHTHNLNTNVNAGTNPGVHSGSILPVNQQAGLVATSGLGAAHENMQPTTFLTAMIKL